MAVIPPGSGPPNTGPVEDIGPSLRAVVWVLTALPAAFLALRIYCKWLQLRGLWWDDWVLIAAWIALMIEAIFATINIPLGLGKHVWDVDPRNLSQISLQSLIGGTFSIIAVVLAKTSFAMTLLRLLDGKTKVFVLVVTVTSIVIALCGALFLWVQCSPVEKNWQPFLPGTCWHPQVTVIIGIVGGTYSTISDWIFALLPWKLVWGLQMQKKEKFGVAIAMSMGVFAGVTSLIKVTKIPVLAGGDFTFEGPGLIIWSAAEASVMIMAASIPVLRVLFRQIKASTQRHYGSHYGSSTERTAARTGRGNTVVVTAHQSRKATQLGHSDDGSDTSILEQSPRSAAFGNKIMQTQEIAVEFRPRSEEERSAYEMEPVKKPRVL